MRATKSTYLPTIGLVGSYGWNESINDNPYAFFNKNINQGFLVVLIYHGISLILVEK